MDAFCITIVRMAGRAFLNDTDFIPFPRGHHMDVSMAVFALDVIDEMGARIMLCAFLFMTAMTGDGFSMNSSPLCFHMGIDIRDIPVATVAGVGSVHRLGKLPLADFSMTTHAFGVVNAFVTVFSTFDDNLLTFFEGFGRFNYF
jgi:hypothetical protein